MNVRLVLATIVCSTELLLGQRDPDIRVDVDLVTVACRVADRNGAPARNLRQEDFILLDDGAPQNIKHLWQEMDLPLTVGLIADVSGSQAGLVSRHRDTVTRFLSRVIGPEDRAFLVTVARDVKLVTDLTSHVQELTTGVGRIDGRQKYGEQLGDPCGGRGRGGLRRIRGCGGTALWNGVYSSARKMRPLTGRKALIVLSDGLDTGSTHSLMDAIEAAQGADTPVYTIKYVSMPTMMMMPPLAVWAALSRGLKRLSEETGGQAFSAPKGSPDETFAQIEGELRSMYVLAFTPPEAQRDGGVHTLEVKMVRADLVVRARKSYRAARSH